MGELIGIFFLCTSKFLAGILWALATDLDWATGLLVTGTGGIVGVVFYLFVFDFIVKYISKRTQHVKVKFNRWRRFMIFIKQKGGLFGIAALTPLLLSIPIGIALSLSLNADKKKILAVHLLSVIIWTFLIFIVKFGLGYDVGKNL